MPIAQIFMVHGRSEERRKAVIEKVTTAIAEAVDLPKESVRVFIQEIPSTDWGVAGQTAKERGR